MTQGINCNPGCEVQIFSILNIPEIASFSFDEHRGWSNVGLYHVGCLFIDESRGCGVCWWIGVGELRFSLQNIQSVKCPFSVELEIKYTYISFLTPSERFVAAAAACEASLFNMPLESEDVLLAFRVAATLFADIRSTISKYINGTGI